MAEAIRYAADHNAKVVNISQAAPASFYPAHCPQQVQVAVAYAAEKDVVVVAGAGNDGDGVNSPNWPAACAGVLAVGGVDSRGEPWVKTQRQDYVSVAAPGVGVGTIGKDGKLGHYGAGTSQATALTSGAAALIRSRYPEMPAREVVQRLIGTALDVGPKGKDDQTGYGVIRIPRALTQEVPKSTPNPPYERLDQWLASGRTAGPTFTPQPGGGGPLIKGWYIAVGAVVLVLAVIAAIVAVVVVRQRGGRGAAANPAPHSWQDVPPPPYGQPGAPPPPYGQQGTHPRPHGRQSESPPPNGEEGVPPGSGQDAPGAD
jgi:subtilisin family serine protease